MKRSASSAGTAARIAACAFASSALVFNGARKSTPCAAATASMPTMPKRLSVICKSRRAPWQAIETWSSWSAEVGVESTEAGNAICLFSLISAALVTSAIIMPEFSPAFFARNGGSP